jgi:acetate kinase
MGSHRVLVINSGSSSLKFQLIEQSTREVLLKGLIERIGSSETPDHTSALQRMLQDFKIAGISVESITVVGHRVVHGGPVFDEAVVITDEVEIEIERLIPLAPLHNAANLTGIQVLRKLLPNIAQVAIFDTAFHSTIPEWASTYAIPNEVAAEFAIRKYGFHGTSCSYVSKRAAEMLQLSVEESNFVICHIGNGASITAVEHGKSVDTSMGMTPLEGLVMGTRSGDLDPGILFHLARTGDYSIDQLESMLNRDSGLKGLAGNQDMREVRESANQGDSTAAKALAIYSYRVRKYIGSYFGVIPDIKAIIFTAGVGENDPDFREDVLVPLRHLGVVFDAEANRAQTREDRFISVPGSSIKVLVISTQEELEIAEQAIRVVSHPISSS